MADGDRAFLARWSRRKTQAKRGVVPAEPMPPGAVANPVPQPVQDVKSELDLPQATQAQVARPDLAPPLTMDDVALLTPASDYSRFVAPGVDAGVSNAAMKKLFSDPHFNVMDRLDTYIDDYSQPDPIPESMLRQMVQAKFLGLFNDEEEDAERVEAAPAMAALDAPPPGAPDNPVHDEDTDLQLQPDDAAGRAGADEGAGPRES